MFLSTDISFNAVALKKQRSRYRRRVNSTDDTLGSELGDRHAHSYGSSKNPELSHIAGILKHCLHLKVEDSVFVSLWY